ncbi:MAG: zinc ribbon domain-containing protein [Candidatus Odinarchaeia archaeon]
MKIINKFAFIGAFINIASFALPWFIVSNLVLDGNPIIGQIEFYPWGLNYNGPGLPGYLTWFSLSADILVGLFFFFQYTIPPIIAFALGIFGSSKVNGRSAIILCAIISFLNLFVWYSSLGSIGGAFTAQLTNGSTLSGVGGWSYGFFVMAGAGVFNLVAALLHPKIEIAPEKYELLEAPEIEEYEEVETLEVKPSRPTKYCPYCGEEIPQDSVYCPKCGKPAEYEEEEGES